MPKTSKKKIPAKAKPAKQKREAVEAAPKKKAAVAAAPSTPTSSPRGKPPRSQAELNTLLNDLVKEKRKMEMIPKGAKVGTVRPYDIKRRYEYGDRVEHPQFGTGVVKVIQPKKMEVAFPEGDRVLLHGFGSKPEADETV